ncbi:type I-B CRISPR-associated endonuclease Cas1b [Cuniculiplasma sp. SKW4]|uniref:type I-B CRISPR-associated endonuclease Cas1b n=1 Tax=Cuniculiplasma sp. SKW4 TaxID=3400171 RepID=UPI003FCF3093
MYDFYISKNGSIEREGNTLYFKGDGFKQSIPVLNISQIIVTAKVSFSSWALDYLAKLNICIHFIRESGGYMSSLIPAGRNEIGNFTVKQAACYMNSSERLRIASEMVMGIKSGILRNLRYYNKDGLLEKTIERINSLRVREDTISSILGVEGNIWSEYYSAFPKIFKNQESFKREFHPPKDPLNAMISFGNALLYSTVLTKIMTTGLNPSISFLHEPSDRSFSLALDIADVFKPMIVERIIGKIVNNNMIDNSDFKEENGGVYLNEHGRKIFLSEYDSKLNTSIKIGKIYTNYDNLIRNECVKIMKHINGEEKYKSIRSWD